MSEFIFRLEIDANGLNGCQRDIKDGQQVLKQCTDPNCPDCAARRCVADLRSQGHTLIKADFIHWPGLPAQVTDDLITGTRHGSFY